MKKQLSKLLIFMLVLPAFLPFAPHKAAHALYEAHVLHHGESTHHSAVQIDHSHGHDHGGEHARDESVHHNAPVDIASYYSDFLHVDLRQTDSESFVPLISLDQDIDYDLSADISAQNRYELALLHARAPPDTHVYDQDYSSLYLETLRLRI